LTGRLLSNEADIVLRFGYRHGPEQRVTVKLRRDDASATGLVARFWAQRKVRELALSEQRNQAALLSLGRRYGLVTPGASLLVLETLEQYLEHDVEPPVSLPEMRESWHARKAVIARKTKETRKSKVDRVAAEWKNRVAWWETDFTNWRKTMEERERQAGEVANEESVPGQIMSGVRMLFGSAPTSASAPPPSPAGS